VAELDGAGGGAFLAREHADEGGFAGAVGPDEGDAVAAVDGEADIVEDVFGAVILGEVVDLDDGAAGRGRLREGEVDDGLFFGNLDALDFFEFFDTALDLLGLGGLVAEAADEGFEVFDLIFLVLVGVLKLGAALGLLGQILLVVAMVDVDVLVPNLDDLLTVTSRK